MKFEDLFIIEDLIVKERKTLCPWKLTLYDDAKFSIQIVGI